MANEPRTRPTDDDIGKDVYDETGDRLGELSAVEGGSLVVDTDPSLTERIKTTLGWGNTQDVYRIDQPSVDRITETAVHVRTGGGTEQSATAGAEPREESTAGTGVTDEGMTTTGTETGDRPTEDRPTSGTDVSPGGEEPGSPIDEDTDPGDVAPERGREGGEMGGGREMGERNEMGERSETGASPGTGETGTDEPSHRGAGEPPTADEELGTTGAGTTDAESDESGLGESSTTLGETGPAGDTGEDRDAEVGDRERGDRDPGDREPRGMSSGERDDERMGKETDVMDDESADTRGAGTDVTDDELTDVGEDEEDQEGVTDDELRDAGDGS